MTRQQIMRRQLLIVLIIAAVAVVALAARGYRLTLAYQTQLGRLTQVGVGADAGPVLVWHDEEALRQIEQALPRYRPGSGYYAPGHGHGGPMVLLLVDEHDRAQALILPAPNEGPVVSLSHADRAPKGNTWRAPELLQTLGRLGLEWDARYGTLDPRFQSIFGHWADRGWESWQPDEHGHAH